MADTRALRLFAVAAHGWLVPGVEARIRAVLATGALEASTHPDEVALCRRQVARAGRGPRGRQVVAQAVAHEWFVRMAVLAFLQARGWEEAPLETTDELTQAWRRWQARVPGLVDLDPLTDLLVPSDLATQGGPWQRTRAVLAADGCERVELLGWLHQHFHSSRRRAVYGALATTRADAVQLGAVTQVFTPDWVARTLLDNSLGRHLGVLDLPYALEPADGAEPVDDSAAADLSVLDPACGTGLLLTHAFDLLYAGARTAGLGTEAAVRKTLGQLHGLDIDPGVVRIAALALTVKAWEQLGGPQAPGAADLPHPDVRTLQTVSFSAAQLRLLPRVATEEEARVAFWNTWGDAGVFGSLVRPDPDATEVAASLLDDAEVLAGLGPDIAHSAGLVVAQNRAVLARHHVVVANPPYLGTRHMGDRLRALAAEHYPVSKGDLATMFLERTLEMCHKGGHAAVVASESWFFTTRTRRVRDLLLAAGHLRTAVCVDASAFGVRVNTVVSVIERGGDARPVVFTRVGRTDLADGPPSSLPAPGRPVLRRDLALFGRVPDRVLVMDLPESLFVLYAKGDLLGEVVDLRQGMATTNNARFLRRWWEVPAEEIVRDHHRGDGRNAIWVPYNKGGSAVRWWGNQEYVVRWEDDARELREVRPDSAVEDRDFFRGSVSWSNIGRNGVQFRRYPPGFVFDVAGMSAFAPDATTELNLLGWLNSPLVRTAMDVLAPTLNYQVGDVARLPVPDLATAGDAERVRELVRLTRGLWAQEPTSWEYAGHPVLLRSESTPLERAEAHVAERDATLRRIARLEQESANHWADAVETLTGVEVHERAPGQATVRPTLTPREYLAQAEHEREHGPRSLIGSLAGR